MNNQEAIKSFPGLGDIDDNFLTKAMLDRSLIGTDQYKPNDQKVNLCVADLYAFAVNNPDVAEGQLSIKQSRSYMLKTAKKMYVENGEPDKAKALGGTHKISSRNLW
jgi:dTDP-glucose pyrophosphorylase